MVNVIHLQYKSISPAFTEGESHTAVSCKSLCLIPILVVASLKVFSVLRAPGPYARCLIDRFNCFYHDPTYLQRRHEGKSSPITSVLSLYGWRWCKRMPQCQSVVVATSSIYHCEDLIIFCTKIDATYVSLAASCLEARFKTVVVVYAVPCMFQRALRNLLNVLTSSSLDYLVRVLFLDRLSIRQHFVITRTIKQHATSASKSRMAEGFTKDAKHSACGCR